MLTAALPPTMRRERVDWFPGKNINRKKQEAKPTGGRPFNSNESITCALALCTLVGGQTNLSRSITVIIVGMLGMT